MTYIDDNTQSIKIDIDIVPPLFDDEVVHFHYSLISMFKILLCDKNLNYQSFMLE